MRTGSIVEGDVRVKKDTFTSSTYPSCESVNARKSREKRRVNEREEGGTFV